MSIQKTLSKSHSLQPLGVRTELCSPKGAMRHDPPCLYPYKWIQFDKFLGIPAYLITKPRLLYRRTQAAVFIHGGRNYAQELDDLSKTAEGPWRDPHENHLPKIIKIHSPYRMIFR